MIRLAPHGILPEPMPIYEYRCDNGHEFEALQAISDDPLTECEECGAPVQKVLHPVAVHFKGSGFYSTDYGSKKKAAAESSNGSDSDSKKDSSSDKKESKSAKGSDSSGSGSSSGGSSSSASD